MILRCSKVANKVLPTDVTVQLRHLALLMTLPCILHAATEACYENKSCYLFKDKQDYNTCDSHKKSCKYQTETQVGLTWFLGTQLQGHVHKTAVASLFKQTCC